MGNLFMKMWNKDPGMACVIAEGTLITIKDVKAHK